MRRRWRYARHANSNPTNYTDPSGHFQYKAPGPDEGKAIAWQLENLFGDVNAPGDTVHIEYGLPPIDSLGADLRPDILLPKTGDVYEIEPFSAAGDAVAEAIYYSDRLTYAGGGGWQIRGQTFVQGIHNLPGLTLNWNRWNLWHLGDKSRIPYMRLQGTVRSVRGPSVQIPSYLTLVVVSPQDGAIIWWYEPSNELYAFGTGFGAAAAKALLDSLRQKYGENLREPPVPVGEPVPQQSQPNQSSVWNWPCPNWLAWPQVLKLLQ